MASLFAGAVAVTVMGWGCNKQQDAKGTDAAATQASATLESSGASGGVAVINYDKVLRDMGWADQLQAKLQAAQDNLKKELTATQTRYEQQLTDYAKSTVKDWDKMSKEEQGKIVAGANMQLRPILLRLQQMAQDQYNAYRNTWIQRYKDALGPIVRQAAQQRKMTIVIGQTDMVVFLDSSADLTDAVVDGARRSPPTITEVPTPVLQAPTLSAAAQPTTLPATLPTTSATTKP